MKISTVFEPKKKIPPERQLFSNKALLQLIYPLLIEQTLMLLVGIIDTLMVSYAGESAVSGVSLVNQINAVFISIFTALAAGGAVVISQYLGRKDKEKGINSCNQLIFIGFGFSVIVTVLLIAFGQPLLGFLYGSVTPEVMEACWTYLWITVLSFPALAVYNCCSAILRSLALTRYTMIVSIIMNIINVVGNAIGIFVLHAGVAGVAFPSLISRYVAALIMLGIVTRTNHEVYVRLSGIFVYRKELFRRIFKIALPNAVENGLLDGLKVLLSSIVALFGTIQIAANGVAQTFWSLAALLSIVMGPVFITVIGRCLGAGDYEAADYYVHKLLKVTYAGCITWNIVTFAMVPLLLMLYNLNEETIRLIIILCLMHNVANAIVQPVGFVLANVLRAAGDVKYAMYTAFAASLTRLGLAYVFGVWMGLGVIGVAMAMICDWIVRAVLISARYLSGKWRNFQVI